MQCLGKECDQICISGSSLEPQREAKAGRPSEQSQEESAPGDVPGGVLHPGPFINTVSEALHLLSPAPTSFLLHSSLLPFCFSHWLCRSPGQPQTGQMVTPPCTCTVGGAPLNPSHAQHNTMQMTESDHGRDDWNTQDRLGNYGVRKRGWESGWLFAFI